MPTLALCVDSHSCHRLTVEIAVTSEMNLPQSVLFCVSYFRVKVPGGAPA